MSDKPMTKEQADIVIALLKEIRDHMAIMSAATKATSTFTQRILFAFRDVDGSRSIS